MSTLLVLSTLVGCAVAQTADTTVSLVLYGGHPNAKTVPGSCTLETHEHFADTMRVGRGTSREGALVDLIGNHVLEWNGQTERIERFSWGCAANFDQTTCQYSVAEQAFNECFGAKPNSNSTAASRAADGEFGPHDFGAVALANYSSFTFYKEAEVNCLGNVGAKYDETAYPFAVATFTGSACEASSTPLKSRLQLYNSVGKGCEALPGPMSPTHADYTNKGYDITVIPHIILPTVTYSGGMDCTRSAGDGSDCTACSIDVNAVDDGTCSVLAGPAGSTGIESIKIGNPKDMSKCPRDPSARGPWQEYGWQITAVFIWLFVVVGGAFAVRGITKYRKRKQYLTLNDDLRSEQASRDVGDAYGLARSGNGRVGNQQRRAAIARQEESLTGVHSANKPTTKLLKTEKAVKSYKIDIP